MGQSGHRRVFENLFGWHWSCRSIRSGFLVQKGHPETLQNSHSVGLSLWMEIIVVEI